MFDAGVDTDREALANQFYQHPLAFDLEELYLKMNAAIPGGSAKDTLNNLEPGRAKLVRDWIQNELLRRSDQTCTAYQARLIHGYIVGDAAIKGTQSALGVVKTLTAPAEILSNAIGGLGGTVTNFVSSDTLKWELFSSTNQRILKSRRTFRNLLRDAQFSAEAKYSISQAIYDAERYHALCNFPAALVGGDDLLATNETEKIIPKDPTASIGDLSKEVAELNKRLETASNAAAP